MLVATATFATTGVSVLAAALAMFTGGFGNGVPWLWLWLLSSLSVLIALGINRKRSAGQRREKQSELQAVRSLLRATETALEPYESHHGEGRTTSPTPAIEVGGTDLAAQVEQLLEHERSQTQQVREEYQGRLAAANAAVVALARSVQSTAHRLQDEATQMVQRHPDDPAVLHTSMLVDHAAAQQARQAQTLAVLCGESPGQMWQEPLSLTDVIRGASSRITAYQRVEIVGEPAVAVVMRMVEPTIHLVAELLANATQSSPPTTNVLVTLRQVQRGAVIEIDDCGVGLDEPRLETYKAIASGKYRVELADLGEVPQTGLAVVGTYASRHDIMVELSESIYGGLRATVLLPAEVLQAIPSAGVNPQRALERVVPDRAPAGSHSSRTSSTALPQRRSPRRHATEPSKVIPTQVASRHQSEPTPEQAGKWMDALLSPREPEEER